MVVFMVVRRHANRQQWMVRERDTLKRRKEKKRKEAGEYTYRRSPAMKQYNDAIVRSYMSRQF